MRPVLALLLCLCLSACAPLRPAPPQTAAALAAAVWPVEGVWRLRQSALFELRGAKVPLSGLLRLDSGLQQARLVGLNDLGVKLFDIEVTPTATAVHFLLPELARFPGAAEAIALSVRRTFLDPRPAGGDLAYVRGESLRLLRQEGGREISFDFDPQQLLSEKRGSGEEEWRVRYHDYRTVAGQAVPGRVVLDDFIGGYRLTLWFDEVRRENE